MGAEWVEDLVDGLVRTLLRMGLINLDLMDLRAIVEQEGDATMLVGVGDPDNPKEILHSAMMAPLAALDVGGATGCLIQIEGGLGMTLSQVDSVARIFTEALDKDAQVILGARVSEDLVNTIRVVTLLFWNNRTLVNNLEVIFPINILSHSFVFFSIPIYIIIFLPLCFPIFLSNFL